MSCSFTRLRWTCLLLPALMLLGACNKSTPDDSASADSKAADSKAADSIVANSIEAISGPIPEAKPSDYEFQAAMRVEAAGEPIEVESPGYACPSLFDLDEDGAEDLIVGQFNGGKMKWYRNLSSPGEAPEYAEGEWINSGDSPAEVPGVY